jgi:hypothetical protein
LNFTCELRSLDHTLSKEFTQKARKFFGCSLTKAKAEQNQSKAKSKQSKIKAEQKQSNLKLI